MAYTDSRIQPRLLALLGCIKTKFEENEIPLCYIGPQSGALTDLWPMGECGSMAWVRVVSLSPVLGTIQQQAQCYVRLSLDIEVGFATEYLIHEDGSSHTEDEDIEQMIEVTNAQMLLLEAILCCEWHDRPKDIEVVGWTPAGPDGGAVGGAWQVSVEIT